MQQRHMSRVPLVPLAVGFLQAVAAMRTQMGPSACVSLYRSGSGSCVMATKCQGVDTSRFEFAFDCRSGNDLVRHSFGFGGFDAQEEFDTGIQCASCEPAADLSPPHPKASHPRAPRATPHAPHVALAAVKPEDVAYYGPGGCVSTWLDKYSGHCFMKTFCANQNMAGYMYALVCVDKQGTPVKHTFGQDSFDPEETFDTLIECAECAGVEASGQAVGPSSLSTMLADVKAIEKSLGPTIATIQRINEKVYGAPSEPVEKAAAMMNLPDPNGPGPAPAPAPSPAALKLLYREGRLDHSAEGKAQKLLTGVVRRQLREARELADTVDAVSAVEETRADKQVATRGDTPAGEDAD